MVGRYGRSSKGNVKHNLSGQVLRKDNFVGWSVDESFRFRRSGLVRLVGLGYAWLGLLRLACVTLSV